MGACLRTTADLHVATRFLIAGVETEIQSTPDSHMASSPCFCQCLSRSEVLFLVCSHEDPPLLHSPILSSFSLPFSGFIFSCLLFTKLQVRTKEARLPPGSFPPWVNRLIPPALPSLLSVQGDLCLQAAVWDRAEPWLLQS